MNNTHRVIERLLAVVLALAACLKGYDWLMGSHLNPAGTIVSSPLVPILVAGEFLLAAWLTLGGFERPRFVCLMACFTFYSTISIYKAAQQAPTCGCFGHVSLPPAVTAMFDVSAVTALWLFRPKRLFQLDSQARIVGIAMRTVLILLASLAFLAIHNHWESESRASAQSEMLAPNSWIGQPFPLFNSIEGASELNHGRWTLVFYHYDCDDCRQAIPKYRAMARALSGQPNSPRLAFIAVPPIAQPMEDPGSATDDASHFSLNADREWVAMTPLVVTLHDGVVTTITSGEQAALPPDVTVYARF